jgi:hypothetical protein
MRRQASKGISVIRVKWRWVVVGGLLALLLVGLPILLPIGSIGDQANPPADVTLERAPTRPPDETVAVSTTPAVESTVTGQSSDRQSGSPRYWWDRMDPLTLADLPGISPLKLGEPGRSVLSPTGATLASFTTATEPNSPAELLVVDLEDWEVRANFTVAGWVASDRSGVVEGPGLATFADDGETLLWVSRLPDERDSVLDPEDFGVFRYRLEGGEPERVYALPPDFAPWEMRLLRDGRLAVFGTPVVYSDEPVPEASRWGRLLLVDLAEGELVGDLELPGVVAGHVWGGEGAGTLAHPGLAWDLPRDRLYLVHAERLAVTVVDLERLAVIRQGEISRASSLGQQLAGRLVPAAQAKSQEGTRRNVGIHPEGSLLYVSGVRWELVYDEEGHVSGERQLSLGLTVIDTDDLTELARLDLPVSDVEVSPNGTHLLLSGVSDGRVVDNHPEHSGLLVLDARTLEQRDHLFEDTIPWIHAFSADGDSVYITAWDQEAEAARLLLLDLVGLAVTSDRFLLEYEQASFHLPRMGLIARWTGEG